LSAATAFIDGLFDLFPGLAGAFLDAADQFVLLAFDILEVVIGELREFLFQFALGNVPVSFGGESSHKILVFVSLCYAAQRGASFFSQEACRKI
jgi:hypothetical protein